MIHPACALGWVHRTWASARRARSTAPLLLTRLAPAPLRRPSRPPDPPGGRIQWLCGIRWPRHRWRCPQRQQHARRRRRYHSPRRRRASSGPGGRQRRHISSPSFQRHDNRAATQPARGQGNMPPPAGGSSFEPPRNNHHEGAPPLPLADAANGMSQEPATSLLQQPPQGLRFDLEAALLVRTEIMHQLHACDKVRCRAGPGPERPMGSSGACLSVQGPLHCSRGARRTAR
jgi:hypothetical protein